MRTKRKTPEPPKEHTRQFLCKTCDMKDAVSGREIAEHLRTVHKMEGKIAGRKSLVLALDGEGFYSNTYDFELDNGVKLVEFANGPSGVKWK